MGQNTDQNPRYLTAEQDAVFHSLIQDPYLRDKYYFTGGTALSAFHLYHRYSEDLDFFTTKPLEKERILQLLQSLSKSLSFTFDTQSHDVTLINILTFKDDKTLKVDFASYPYPILQPPSIYKGFQIDSTRDITANKLTCINQRSEVKDFVDLYFLLKEWNIWDASYGYETKFSRRFEPFLFSSDLSIIEDFKTLPRMIKPITLDELKVFYLNLAKELVKDSVE
ncbi:hypothetical protein COV58_00020 [Candidatus Roizmanbacteria bacterium CG11_big_fil_rev_8_21_14_0_20_36_8]|uniref:Nucleotidyl transferase AbiEii/AbiGii toxin family protein n=2 Tax=Candidatus Roizmaniibacteriota TaxID=1752723 RepID=A0A2M6IVP3_9BACT|nr:MAG: hypothetical protein COV58_00020 [Candidatus Roizmanbacteria bacterium CG11_big_fil_rev_8_21_14_0_20_36_8]PIZ65211.1 MAG: hypothetical protein COY14_02920 [Candidatus Roizmanbacteria bacterium CG_4_10_14_0_2_um_filter_36_9]